MRGHEFRDEREAGVMMISESLALSLYGDLDAALGASVQLENAEDRLTIVGIAADRIEAAAGGMNGVVRVHHAYLPLGEGDATQLRFLVRSAGGDPITLAPSVTAELRAADPGVVLMTPVVLGQMLREGTGNLRFFATIFSGLGSAALLLAAIGIYGVVAYIVGRRTREIGVRITLGATRTHIFRHVLASVVKPVGIGLAAGALGALGLGLLLQSVLYGVSPTDPTGLAASLLGFIAATVLAAGIPARQATRIDPLQATRSD